MGVEGWRGGGVEGWRSEGGGVRVEGWRDGEVEGWRGEGGVMEGWRLTPGFVSCASGHSCYVPYSGKFSRGPNCCDYRDP